MKRYSLKEIIERKSLRSAIFDFRHFKNQQKFTSLEDTSEYNRNIINADIKKILHKYPETEVVMLAGSYSTGEYINRKTNGRFIRASERIKLKKYKGGEERLYSDRDYYIFPEITTQIDYLGIDINLLKKAKQNMIPVYNKKTGQ